MANTGRVVNKNIESVYPLTPMQEGILYHQLADNSSHNYLLQTCLRVKGAFNTKIARDSVQLLAHKYEVLRTLIAIGRM